MIENFLSGGVGKDPYISNKSYFDKYGQEMDAAASRYDPWMQRGNQSGDLAFNAYQRDLANPNYMQDKVASGFSMSPYQQYMQDLVTKRLNYNSANTGMMGSGAANRALMQELTKNTGQFENDYINRGLGLYGQALGGLGGIEDRGLRAGASQDNLMQEAAGGRLKGGMSENETMERNRQANSARSSNMLGSILGLAGGAAGTLFGGPAGTGIGSSIGNAVGNLFGGNSGGGYSPSNYTGNGGTNSGNWSY